MSESFAQSINATTYRPLLTGWGFTRSGFAIWGSDRRRNCHPQCLRCLDREGAERWPLDGVLLAGRGSARWDSTSPCGGGEPGKGGAHERIRQGVGLAGLFRPFRLVGFAVAEGALKTFFDIKSYMSLS